MEQITAISVRQRYSAEIWKERITDCRGSGQTVKDWCAQNNVSCKTYYRWERKLLAEVGQRMICPQTKAEQNRFGEIPAAQAAGMTVGVIRGENAVCEIHSGISAELLAVLARAMNGHA